MPQRGSSYEAPVWSPVVVKANLVADRAAACWIVLKLCRCHCIPMAKKSIPISRSIDSYSTKMFQSIGKTVHLRQNNDSESAKR